MIPKFKKKKKKTACKIVINKFCTRHSSVLMKADDCTKIGGEVHWVRTKTSYRNKEMSTVIKTGTKQNGKDEGCVYWLFVLPNKKGAGTRIWA